MDYLPAALTLPVDALQPRWAPAVCGCPRFHWACGITSATSTFFQNGRDIARRAFDLGITHFDLANNYGPSPGFGRENFGLLMKKDFHPFRDELMISSKAGYLVSRRRAVR